MKLKIYNFKMRGIFVPLVFLALLLFGLNPKCEAQTYPKDYGFWNDAGENHGKQIDVFYKVSQCTSTSKDTVFIRVFNEKPADDTTTFDVVIYNSTKSDSTTTSITSLVLKGGEMLDRDCGSGHNNSLAIQLPTGYDPEKITIQIKFN